MLNVTKRTHFIFSPLPSGEGSGEGFFGKGAVGLALSAVERVRFLWAGEGS